MLEVKCKRSTWGQTAALNYLCLDLTILYGWPAEGAGALSHGASYLPGFGHEEVEGGDLAGAEGAVGLAAAPT